MIAEFFPAAFVLALRIPPRASLSARKDTAPGTDDKKEFSPRLRHRPAPGSTPAHQPGSSHGRCDGRGRIDGADDEAKASDCKLLLDYNLKVYVQLTPCFSSPNEGRPVRESAVSMWIRHYLLD